MKIYGDETYEQQFSTKGWGQYPSEEVIRFFMRSKDKLGNFDIRALDIGCGIGSQAWFMVKEGAVVTAMDGAPSGLLNVNKLTKEFGINGDIDVVLGDITQPKIFLNSTYNMMVDNYSLYSNEENRTFNGFREYFDLLEKGGFLLTCCFGKKTSGYSNGRQLSENTYTDIQGYFSKGGTQSFFSRDYLILMFKKIGYSIDYYSDILEETNGNLIEKHITYLKK